MGCGISDLLRCPGPAARPRTWPGQPPGTHRVRAFGVFDTTKGRIVSIGSESKFILLDEFDYPADRGLAELLDVPEEVEGEMGCDSPEVVAAAMRARKQQRGAKLRRDMVSQLKQEIATPGWRVKDILLRYDISQASLWLIRKGQLWGSVPGPAPVPPTRTHYVIEARGRGRDC